MTTLFREPEKDFLQLVEWFKGEREPAHMIMAMFRMFHVWDDLVDGDPVTDKDINEAFWIALVALPQNHFYREYEDTIRPVMVQAIQDWKVANVLEKNKGNEQNIAYTLRCTVVGIIHYCALIIGGPEWADEVGPDIWRYGLSHTLEQYLENL